MNYGEILDEYYKGSELKEKELPPPSGRVFGLGLMSSDEPNKNVRVPKTQFEKDVRELRQKTGFGIGEVKRALKEAEGDMEKALDILKNLGPKRSY